MLCKDKRRKIKIIFLFFIITIFSYIFTNELSAQQNSKDNIVKVKIKCKKYEKRALGHVNAHYVHNNDVGIDMWNQPELYVNLCIEWEGEFDTVNLLSAMPEIGISRIDPNLIEY